MNHEDRFQLEVDRNEQLNALDDSALADLLLEEVWGPLSLSPEATIVGQAYDRLKRSRGGALITATPEEHLARPLEPCPECFGAGVLKQHLNFPKLCPICNGRGEVP